MDKRLTKSENRMLSGVCGGIAEYLGWDATLVRVVYALLSLCSAGFPGLLIYIILAILMPSKEG
jgi:phage shock protein C